MRTITLALAASLVVSSTQPFLVAQEAKEKKESAAPSIDALVAATKVRLDKAITRALEARDGVAVGVELEGRLEGGAVVSLFEVMVGGKDGVVYEVFVNGVDGKIVSSDPCKDEADVDEVKSVVAKGETHTLQEIVSESGALLRGTCVQAALSPTGKQAHVVMLNRGRRLDAQWSLKDAQLLGVVWLDAKKSKKVDDDDDEENEEEGEEHEGGEHAKGESKKAGQNGKTKKAKGEEEEGEEEAEKEGKERARGESKNREHEKSGKGNGGEPKQSH